MMRAGDDADFTAFVAASSRRLLRTAYLITGDAETAQDLLGGDHTSQLTSRRYLTQGGLAMAASLALARSPARHRIMLGVNRNYYTQFTRVVPLARAVRIYYDTENVFPVTWPARLPGAWAILSIRPHPHDLLAGQLDQQLKALIQSAPAHSELAVWHEATPGNPLGYPAYVNARSMRRMQAHMQRLCRGSGVRFGSIICGPADQMA